MSERIVYIGEAPGALGLRLTGIEVVDAAAAEVPAAFDRAREQAALILLSRRAADALPPGRLRAARLASTPLVAVLPALDAPAADPGLVLRLRALLGIVP